MTKLRQAKYLIFLAVLSELVILTDSLAMWISRLISSDIILQGVISYIFIYVFWISGIFVIRRLYRKNEVLHFSYTEKPTGKYIVFGILLLAVSFTVSYINWGGFKVYLELLYGIQNGGTALGIAQFIAQYVYYFLETILFFNIIKYSQRAGELLFGNDKIPYGGIVAAATWGLLHIIFHGVIDGLTTTFIALLMGVAYLVMRKNPKYAFILIFLMFIL